MAITERSTGLIGHRSQLHLGLRVGAHLGATASDLARGRRRRRVGLGGASILADIALSRSLRHDDRDRSPVLLVAGLLDALAWGGSGDRDPTSVRWLVNSSVTGAAIEAGYRFVGPTARPLPRPGTRAIRLVAPTLLPALAMSERRRRRGWQMSWVEWLGLGAFGTLGGALLARHHRSLQAAATARWDAREDDHLAEQRDHSRAEALSATTDAHDFKSTLIWLGALGSEPAARLGREQLDWPARRLTELAGQPLRWAIHGLPVEPPSAWTTWLPSAQVEELNRLIDLVETEPGSRGLGVRVLGQDRNGLHLDVLGHPATLATATPELQASLDPVGTILTIGAAWKALTLQRAMGATNPFAVATSIAVDIGLTRVHRRRAPSTGNPVPIVLIGAIANSAALAIASARRRTLVTRLSPGVPVFPFTGAVLGSVGLLGHFWTRLGWTRWAGSAAIAVTWLGCVRHAGDPTPIEVAAELANFVQVLLATHGMVDRMASEAATLEARLQRRFDDRIAGARRQALEDEVARYRGQLVVARAEFARLAADPEIGIGPAVATSFDQQCRAFEEVLCRLQPSPSR